MLELVQFTIGKQQFRYSNIAPAPSNGSKVPSQHTSDTPSSGNEAT